jgi:hypothetical protein
VITRPTAAGWVVKIFYAVPPAWICARAASDAPRVESFSKPHGLESTPLFSADLFQRGRAAEVFHELTLAHRG